MMEITVTVAPDDHPAVLALHQYKATHLENLLEEIKSSAAPKAQLPESEIYTKLIPFAQYLAAGPTYDLGMKELMCVWREVESFGLLPSTTQTTNYDHIRRGLTLAIVGGYLVSGNQEGIKKVPHFLGPRYFENSDLIDLVVANADLYKERYRMISQFSRIISAPANLAFFETNFGIQSQPTLAENLSTTLNGLMFLYMKATKKDITE